MSTGEIKFDNTDFGRYMYKLGTVTDGDNDFESLVFNVLYAIYEELRNAHPEV